MSPWVYGRRAVAEFLDHAPEGARRLLVARGARVPAGVMRRAREAGLPVEEVPRPELDRRSGGVRHQGVALEVGGWAYRDLDEVAARAHACGLPLLVALDCVQDPRNLGAVLRVVDAVGAAGVVIPRDRSAGLGPAAARASAGAVASVPVARVVNLARALDALRDRGFWVYGASAGGENLFAAEVRFPAVLVLGSEHRGIRPNVAARCDRTLALPMRGTVGSLNVSAACAVVCYELLRRRSTPGA